jgi:hypothetical protein
MLSQDQQDFLEQNRPHYDTLIKADFLTNLGYQVKEELLNTARVFAPAYQANLWCGPCVCDLVKFVYTQYDKWLLAQPKELPADVQRATFPKHDKPEIAKKKRKNPNKNG